VEQSAEISQADLTERGPCYYRGRLTERVGEFRGFEGLNSECFDFQRPLGAAL